MKPLFILSVAVMLINLSCKKDETSEGIIVMKDVAFGNHISQKFDAHLPANRNEQTTKALILIHGGAWISGDKTDFDSTIRVLASQLPDYAFFNLNYRLANLSGDNKWPAQIDDINAAYSFIISKSGEYKFNPSKVVIGGASAGAHLALLKAYKFGTPPGIKAVVDLFGPTDMKGIYEYDANYAFLFNSFMGGPPTANPAVYENASPLYQVSASVPPTLIFHGGKDMVVPIKQSDSLSARLQAVNVATEYYVYPNEGHSWYGPNLQDTYQKIIAFIKKHNP